jgi:hypothetical protein
MQGPVVKSFNWPLPSSRVNCQHLLIVSTTPMTPFIVHVALHSYGTLKV